MFLAPSVYSVSFLSINSSLSQDPLWYFTHQASSLFYCSWKNIYIHTHTHTHIYILYKYIYISYINIYILYKFINFVFICNYIYLFIYKYIHIFMSEWVREHYLGLNSGSGISSCVNLAPCHLCLDIFMWQPSLRIKCKGTIISSIALLFCFFKNPIFIWLSYSVCLHISLFDVSPRVSFYIIP